MTSPITAGGLLLDIAGAYVLAMAFMFKNPKEARREAATGIVGGNTFLYISLAKQTADAWVGATLLTGGFLAQLLDNAIGGERPSWLCLGITLSIAGALIVVAVLLLHFVVRPIFVGRAVESRLGFTWREVHRPDNFPNNPAEAVRQWWIAVEVWGWHIGQERRERESLQYYGRRVLGQRRWNRVGSDKPPPIDYEPPRLWDEDAI